MEETCIWRADCKLYSNFQLWEGSMPWQPPPHCCSRVSWAEQGSCQRQSPDLSLLSLPSTLRLVELMCSGGSETKESACSEGDPGSIPESGISPGEGNGNPLKYSCLENSRDRGAWWAAVRGVTKSRTWLSDSHFHFSPPLSAHVFVFLWKVFSEILDPSLAF